ncbi:hypothetical protein EVAR_52904_1 [Eumeta japonica]|uniref:Uncharacterized protein n=1 Tax=Eumeta variegata TaxID=151549 RepID=A0A4C1Z283_EUMVA|nr:hypothetical protein EVAR_52904_1 [Eumeta japonica]
MNVTSPGEHGPWVFSKATLNEQQKVSIKRREPFEELVYHCQKANEQASHRRADNHRHPYTPVTLEKSPVAGLLEGTRTLMDGDWVDGRRRRRNGLIE